MADFYPGKRTTLDVLSYARLVAKDETEIKKMIDICETSGIFFLDLAGTDAGRDFAPIIAAQRKFFGRDEEAKVPFAIDHPARGWDEFKELSVQRIKMSREQQLDSSLALPADLQTVAAQLSALFTFNDSLLRSLALLLCASVSPAVPTRSFADAARPGHSNLCLGIAAAAANTSIMPAHLDEDVLTITYYDEPFLEVQDRATGAWALVDVCAGMPIVNVGGQLRDVSAGRFHAPPHRVVQTPNEINLVMYDMNAAVVEEGGKGGEVAVAA